MIAVRRPAAEKLDDTPSPAYRARRALGAVVVAIGAALVVLDAFARLGDPGTAITLTVGVGAIMGGIAVLVTLAGSAS